MFLYAKAAIAAALILLGIVKLNHYQHRIMPAIYAGRDVFVMLSTGGGKSLLYQLPAICEKGRGVTIVICPLIALQQDQVMALSKKGIKAVAINSHLSKYKRKEILNDLTSYCLIYLAPEQLRKKDFLAALEGVDVNRVVVDEAHVLPQSMADFRPAYGEIGDFIDNLPFRPQILALTATATTYERKQIISALGMNEVKKFIFPVRRDNLSLYVKVLEPISGTGTKAERLESSFSQAVLAELMEWDGNGQAVIYAPFKKRANEIYDWLKANDAPRLGLYTGDTKPKKRKKLVKKFKQGKIQVMIATSAFGLGIDVPNVHLVIHAGLPLSMDAYVQEIGRAGRNGKEARCVLYFAKSDYKTSQDYLSRKTSPNALPYALWRLTSLQSITDAKNCLWKEIERYYGEKPGKRCHTCCACRLKE